MATLNEVVAEDKVLGERAFQHLLEHPQVVDALATERAFVEDILVEFERGGGIDIQTAQTCEQLRIAALVGHLHVDIDARLHDAVAAVHPPPVGTQLRTVQRVRHGTDKLLRRIEHQLGVGIQRDNKLNGRAISR